MSKDVVTYSKNYEYYCEKCTCSDQEEFGPIQDGIVMYHTCGKALHMTMKHKYK